MSRLSSEASLACRGRREECLSPRFSGGAAGPDPLFLRREDRIHHPSRNLGAGDRPSSRALDGLVADHVAVHPGIRPPLPTHPSAHHGWPADGRAAQLGASLLSGGRRPHRLREQGGGPYDPLWVANLAADPHCWLRIRRRLVPATGRVVRGEERVELFEKVATQHGGLRHYQEQASAYGREIPLVALTPRAEVPGH